MLTNRFNYSILTIPNKRFAWIFFSILLLQNCNRESSNLEHPEYFKHILKIADTLHSKYADAAIYTLDSTLSQLPGLTVGDKYIKDSVKVVVYSFVKNDYLKALQYADSMVLLVKDNLQDEKYAERYVKALYVKGTCYANLKNYYEALYYFKMAEKESFKYVRNKCNVAEFGGVFALLMFKQEKYAEAARYFLRQHTELESGCSTDSYRHMRDLEASYNNAAISYLKAGMPDSAAYYQEKALQIITLNEKKFPADSFNIAYAKAVIYGDQAEVLAYAGKYAAAETLYIKSINVTRSADILYTQNTQVRLAAMYLDNNQFSFAENMLSDLKKSLDTTRDNEHYLISWYKLKARLYTKQNEPTIASGYLERYQSLSDSAAARDKKFYAEDIGKEFENLELKFSNEVLQKENKLKSLYLAIAIITFSMLAIIAMLVWYNSKKTRRHSIELQLRNDDTQKALQSLELSYRENNRIMSIVAHDLTNPVSAIKNLSTVLLATDQPPKNKENLEHIKTASDNSLALISEILRNERLNKSEKDLVDMKQLLEYCVELLQTDASKKNQLLILKADAARLLLDRKKFWRVINNIIGNAIKFSPEHGRINITLQRQKDCVLLSVQDNGIGIPENIQEQILSTEKITGTDGTFGEKSHGLGLVSSKMIIEEHNGRLWFNTKQGVGTTFYVELPFA